MFNVINIVAINWQYLHTVYYPHAFLKKCRGIAIASVHLSVRLSVTLSPPKPLDEIQPNLVCELLT